MINSHRSKHSKKKRGVSPLIATVLLIAFAVALGAVVMNWGRSYTEQVADNVQKQGDVQLKCSQDVKLEVVELDDNPQFCLGEWGANSYVNFTLRNPGTKKMESLQVTFIGETDVLVNSTVPNSSIAKEGGYSRKMSVGFPFSQVGKVKKVEIVPVVEINGIQSRCTGKGSTLSKDGSDLIACNST